MGLSRAQRDSIYRKHGIPINPKVAPPEKTREAIRQITYKRPEPIMFQGREISSREMQVLGYVAHGLTNQEIADNLYLSIETVKSHIKHVLDKLGAKNRQHAVFLAFVKYKLHQRGNL